MPVKFDYDTFVLRNQGYVSPETQATIHSKTLLFAGCGIGSGPAVAAARFGFEKFILVDGDTVDAHNLNRQFYDFADIGRPKVEALKGQILRINPEAQVEAIHQNLDPSNTEDIVARADIVLDTVDFLDLPAILTLHTAAAKHGVELLTALSIGFGAGVIYFPAGSGLSLASLIENDVKQATNAGDASYAEVFKLIVARIAQHLDTQVVEQIGRALTIMEDGKPCPASQVSVGSFTLGALATTLMHDILAGLPVPQAPNMVVHSFRNHQTKLINLSG